MGKKGKDYEVFVRIETNILFLLPPKDRIEEIKRNSLQYKVEHEANKELHGIVEDYISSTFEEELKEYSG